MYSQLVQCEIYPSEEPAAVFVPPPCRVIRGRQRTFTAPRVNASSVALLLQT